MDGEVVNDTYTETDYREECEVLEEKASQVLSDKFVAFVDQCAKSGLSARRCHETHWQIFLADTKLVDFWPTAKKIRACQCKNKEKARRGDAADAIALAAMLSAKTVKAPKVAEDRKARRERIATAAMAGYIAGDIDDVLGFGKCAELAVKSADALIAELDKSEVANG